MATSSCSQTLNLTRLPPELKRLPYSNPLYSYHREALWRPE
jgi:hypothetical protein